MSEQNKEHASAVIKAVPSVITVIPSVALSFRTNVRNLKISDGTAGKTASHPTRQPKDGCQVVGYSHSTKPLKNSGQVADYPSGRNDNRCSLQRGFTLLELIVVITIIVFLMALFMNRMLFYQEQAEKTAMEQVVGVVQSALTLHYGEILTRGKPSDVPALARDNPMNWLQKRPPNYSGEFYDPTPQAVVPGNWMFDLKTRDLIYVPSNTNYFKPGKDGKKWIRFHVAVNYEASRLPSLQNAPHELTGIVFEPVEPYSWF